MQYFHIFDNLICPSKIVCESCSSLLLGNTSGNPWSLHCGTHGKIHGDGFVHSANIFKTGKLRPPRTYHKPVLLIKMSSKINTTRLCCICVILSQNPILLGPELLNPGTSSHHDAHHCSVTLEGSKPRFNLDCHCKVQVQRDPANWVTVL